MTLGWQEHPGAREEFLDAHDHYLDIHDGVLGDQFRAEVKAAIDLIRLWPDAPPPYLAAAQGPIVRAWHLGKFPYRLIYVVRESEVFVLAYAHDKRHPGYWSDRLTP